MLASLSGPNAWRLYVTIVLMTANWGIETLKWQILLRHLFKIPFVKALKSVISGVAFTMITPNRTGEFIGRVFYVPEGNRIRAAALTLISSASQLIVTLAGGSIGLLVLRHYLSASTETHNLSIGWIDSLIAGTILILLIVVLFYFRIRWLVKLVRRIPKLSRYDYFIEPLEEVEVGEFVKILLLSAIRYGVFIVQYWLLFKLFDVQMLSWQLSCVVTVLFLVLAVVPTIALAELGIRSKASIILFSIFSSNTIGILVATATIWLINIIFPAVIGSLFVLGVKLFGKE